MIKFFRKIRQNLLMENKTSKYFKYAIGEIVLVVIGILIALSINNWNIKNVQQKEVRTYLISIKSNLIQDTLSLSLRTLDIKQNIQTFDSISSLIIANESKLLGDSNLVSALLATHRFITEKNSFVDLTSNGKFNLIKNKKITKKILSYYNYIEERVGGLNNSLDIYTRETLAPYFMKNYQLKFPIPFNLKLSEDSNIVSKNKDVLFEINAIKYRYFMLSQLSDVYAEADTNAKKIIELIDDELIK